MNHCHHEISHKIVFQKLNAINLKTYFELFIEIYLYNCHFESNDIWLTEIFNKQNNTIYLRYCLIKLFVLNYFDNLG